MGKRPKLEGILRRMKKGLDFELTRSMYIKLTGVDIPQDKSYTERKSAIAKLAETEGYEVIVIQEKLLFRRKI